MKALLSLPALSLILSLNSNAQFNLTPENWTLPYLENTFAAEDQVQSTNYTVMDFNGDGKPDLIDAQNHATGESWNDGSVSHWKVYINNGSGFNSTPQNWTLPYLENTFAAEDQVQSTNYTVMDFNGDGKPDLIDAQNHATGESWNDGSVSHWKVYINNGSGFNSTPQNWTLPYLENTFAAEDQVQSTNYSVIDFNGDGKPDLVDAQNHATGESWNDGAVSHWKVYINNGSGFNSSPQNWTLPYLENTFAAEDQVQSTNYSVIDFNGDGKPDLIDAQNHATGESWNDGAVSHWKVYINNGAGFNSSPQNWTLPYLENTFAAEDQVNSTNYSVVDFNVDNKPDLVDAQNHATGESWNDGAVSHWKVYINNGSGFNGSAENWTLPFLENTFAAEDQVFSTNYTVMDFDGNGSVDLIDAQNHATGESWNDGSVSHWKVYLNTTVITTGISEITELQNISTYPNPTNGPTTINLNELEGTSHITITNSLGAVIMKDVVTDQSNYNFDLTEYNTGLYFISVTNNNQTYISKIMKR